MPYRKPPGSNRWPDRRARTALLRARATTSAPRKDVLETDTAHLNLQAPRVARVAASPDGDALRPQEVDGVRDDHLPAGSHVDGRRPSRSLGRREGLDVAQRERRRGAPRLVRISSDSKALVSTRTGIVSLLPLSVPERAGMKEPSLVFWSLTTPYAPNGPLPVTLSTIA